MTLDTSALHSAGTGSPVPAESLQELTRIRRRFTELSVPDAQIGMRLIRPLLDLLTDRLGQPAVPDLGPAPVPDQLTVLVFDAYRDGAGQGLNEELVTVRRALP